MGKGDIYFHPIVLGITLIFPPLCVYALICYKCVTEIPDGNPNCAKIGIQDAASHSLRYNRILCNISVVCEGSESWCFVRSRCLRSQPRCAVQRGCLHWHNAARLFDSPRLVCSNDRTENAEVRSCLCQSDRCNGAIQLLQGIPIYLLSLLTINSLII